MKKRKTGRQAEKRETNKEKQGEKGIASTKRQCKASRPVR
jgi:hypothetical protein